MFSARYCIAPSETYLEDMSKVFENELDCMNTNEQSASDADSDALIHTAEELDNMTMEEFLLDAGFVL